MEKFFHLLVTAGATRNPIDAVRFLSAQSSGKTGVYLAERFAEAGGQVTLLGSPEACLRSGADVLCREYGSTHDLLKQMETWIKAHPSGAVIHASAVGDYEFIGNQDSKIPSGKGELVLRFQATPKIAPKIRGWGLLGPLVTFKAAPPEVAMEALLEIAGRQRTRTGSDWVFANVLGKLDSLIAIVGDKNQVYADRTKALEGLVERVLTKYTSQ